jgi:hypothetical protein
VRYGLGRFVAGVVGVLLLGAVFGVGLLWRW